MVVLLGTLILALFILPLVLSGVAIFRVGTLRNEVNELRALLRQLSRTQTKSATPAPAQEIREQQQKPMSPPVAVSATLQPLRPARELDDREWPPSPKTGAGEQGLECLMGGKAAAFAGMGILLAGIVFLVGYAVQHAWMGPGIRTLGGLLAGAFLVALGHFMNRKEDKYLVLARVLTGGGSALFYFTVYAAYGFYHLIGMGMAGIGLLGSACAVFGLSLAYRSQSVALVAVLGAFITPFLMGGERNAGLFLPLYAAVVNIPVILLGVRRNWQVLYNLAFISSIIYYIAWHEQGGHSAEWMTEILLALLFYAECAALGLWKLRCEQQITGRIADSIRILAGSLLLMLAVYAVLDDAGLNHRMGVALAALTLMHMGLAWLAFRILRQYTVDMLAFLSGGILCAALTLPAQWDWAWVTLGWAFEGAIIAWFAHRVKSGALQTIAFLLGMIGLQKALFFDEIPCAAHISLFFNARFASGFASVLMLAVQGHFARRPMDDREDSRAFWGDLIWWAASIGMLSVFCFDIFRLVGIENEPAWLACTLIMLALGVFLLFASPRESSVRLLGGLFMLLVPAGLMLDAIVQGYLPTPSRTSFFNLFFLTRLFVLFALVPAVAQCVAHKTDTPVLGEPRAYALLLNMLSLLAGIGVISLEFSRTGTAWADPAITLFWTVCALAFILYGLKKWSAPHRYLGLLLFTVATAKAILVDASERKGLERITVLIGTGIMLLLLSFAYQKAAAYFQRTERDE